MHQNSVYKMSAILWQPQCINSHLLTTSVRSAAVDSPLPLFMMTSSNGNIFRVTGHLCGEFTGPRWIPHTKTSDAELWCFFDLRLHIRLSKQSWGWWFETLSRSLWRHRYDWGRVTHICDTKLSLHLFRYWLVLCSAPSHYLNQCWNIDNCTFRIKRQWNFYQNSNVFIHENTSEHVIYK